MKFSYSWLKQHLDTTLSPLDLTNKLTSLGLEVSKVINPGDALKNFIIAKILKASPHPNADKLQVCEVEVGKGDIRQVVCGALNARADLKVVFAAPGVFIPGAGFTIKESAIRGVQSRGMLCSFKELSLGESHEGIIELPADAPVGGSFVAYMNLDDPVFEIGLTPNRGDCLSVRGIACDLAAAGCGTLLPLPSLKSQSTFESPIRLAFSKEVRDANAVSHFVGYYIKGVKNGPSPAWLQKKLESIGITPISTLVDITNYLSYDIGRPLHVFDAAKIKGNCLTVRFAKKGETLKTLDHKTHTLDETMTVVADDTSPLAIGGIIGGEESGCTVDTTDVFLEAAYFDKVRTALTGRILGVLTDARYRFERGIDPESTEIGCAYAAHMIVDLCGGDMSHPVICGEKVHNVHEITLQKGHILRRTGLDISLEKAADYLERLGCVLCSKSEESIRVKTPSFRHDLTREEDLIEEVVRLEGYHHIPVVALPMLQEKRSPFSLTDQMKHKARYTLAERGLSEVLTWSMVDEKAKDMFGPIDPSLKISNPISQDLLYMRPSILPNLLMALQKNWDHGERELAFFEIGPTYKGNKPEDQSLVAAGTRLGKMHALSWNAEDRDADVYDVKGDVLALLDLYGITEGKYQLDESALPSWYHPGRAMAIKQGPKRILGYFGEIHPLVLKTYGLKKRAVVFEIDLMQLPLPKGTTSNRGPYERPKFQRVERDFAFIAEKTTKADALIDVIKRVDQRLIREAYVFDVFEGEGVEETKKSLSIHVIIQPQDATLRDVEIKSIYDKIIAAVAEKTGALLRL
jgi:phenylalanyl-tRNA synthetase beta chain